MRIANLSLTVMAAAMGEIASMMYATKPNLFSLNGRPVIPSFASSRLRLVENPGRFNLSFSDSLINPVVSQEAKLYSDIDTVMGPYVQFFMSQPKFNDWYISEALVLPENDKKAILDDLNKNVRSIDNLAEFWKMTAGEIAKTHLGIILNDLQELDTRIKRNSMSGVSYEFGSIFERQTKNDSEFYNASKMLLDNLTLGHEKYAQKSFNEVFEPFLNAAVVYKDLHRRMTAKI